MTCASDRDRHPAGRRDARLRRRGEGAPHDGRPRASKPPSRRRTKAIVPVHLYGRLADVDAIADFAKSRGLFLVEDCAQAHGATLGGRPAGSFGDAAAWSFYPTKNLGALGDGGAVTTARPDVADANPRSSACTAMSRATTPTKRAGTAGSTRCRRPPCASASASHGSKPAAGADRRPLRRGLRRRLASFLRTPPPARAGETPAHHLYVVRVDGPRRLSRAPRERRGSGRTFITRAPSTSSPPSRRFRGGLSRRRSGRSARSCRFLFIRSSADDEAEPGDRRRDRQRGADARVTTRSSGIARRPSPGPT